MYSGHWYTFPPWINLIKSLLPLYLQRYLKLISALSSVCCIVPRIPLATKLTVCIMNYPRSSKSVVLFFSGLVSQTPLHFNSFMVTRGPLMEYFSMFWHRKNFPNAASLMGSGIAKRIMAAHFAHPVAMLLPMAPIYIKMFSIKQTLRCALQSGFWVKRKEWED